MKNQLDFVNNKQMREDNINRLEVLDAVKEIITFAGSDFISVELVAEYYEVPIETIKTVVKRNKDELKLDGLKAYTNQEVKEIISRVHNEPTKINSKGMTLIPKRAMLRIGMLLRDSEVAKELRTRLLDIVHDAEEVTTSNGDTIVENIVSEIGEEKSLIMERVEAEMSGDYYKVCEINAKLFALKNKRIKELETEVENITTHSLTIVESKKVVNRLVRMIAIKSFNGAFGKAYSELYTKVNYQLGINIKNRTKKSNQTYLDLFTESELYKVEEIVRTWANKINIDIQQAISLAV